MKDIERRIRNLEKSRFGTSGNGWHSLSELPDGTKVGKIGSMSHVVDDMGYPLSGGYHTITCIRRGEYIGELGSVKERFSV